MNDPVVQKIAIAVAVALVLQVIVALGSWKHIVWRIGRLEERVDRHNGFAERLAKIEGHMEGEG